MSDTKAKGNYTFNIDTNHDGTVSFCLILQGATDAMLERILESRLEFSDAILSTIFRVIRGEGGVVEQNVVRDTIDNKKVH
jgi:hypothetical protein